MKNLTIDMSQFVDLYEATVAGDLTYAAFVVWMTDNIDEQAESCQCPYVNYIPLTEEYKMEFSA